MTLKSLNLLFVSLLLISGAASAFAQQAAPAAPKAPKAPDTPSAFSFVFEGGSFLGVYTEDINRENMGRYNLGREPRGVGITKVMEGSPAERAGLRKDDVILKFDNETVTSVRKLNRLIGETAPEHSVRLTIARGGDEKDLSVTLGKRSDFNTAYALPNQRWEDLERLRDFKFDNKDNNTYSFVFGNNRRIGVTTTQLTKQLADYFGVPGGKGLLITSVRDDSPAAKAGLRAGDVITEADGNAVGAVSDLMRALNRKDAGELTLTIIHDKSQRTIRLTPEANKDTNLLTPGVYFTPQAMRVAIPKIEIREMPKIVMPAMPALPAMPSIALPPLPKISVPATVMSLPDMPL